MIIGIDIGGTYFRVGAVSAQDEVLRFEKIPTAAILHTGDVLADLAAFLREYSRDMPAEAVAVGFPATLDRERKRVLQAPNLKYMEDLPVVDFLQEALQVPVFAERDVTFALCYDVRKYQVPTGGITAGIYFGTGVGNAILVNGIPLVGKNGTAGELGHIPADGSREPCGCGNIGCMENLAGGKYLARLQQTCFPDTPIGELFAAHGDDPLLVQYTDRMAMTAAAEINILDPDQLLIGGGVPAMKAFPLERLRAQILAHTRKPYPAGNLEICFTADEEEKGVVGGAYYARAKLGGC